MKPNEEQFEKFVKVLREMFMIDDAADLDFGIYKVMHQKQEDIEKYMKEDLQKNVQDEISQNVRGRRRFVEEELQKAKQGALSLGVPMSDIMNVPRVKALAEELEGLTPTDELENMTYDHLARFFSRYYDDGDFISKRRYSSVHDDSKYAIPYGGEEVMMYWANQDQYYIKSSEYLKNYSFNLDGDKKVVFRVVNAASEDIGNNKTDEDLIRCFALADSDDEDFIFANGSELTIRFTYELMKKERDIQEKLINSANTMIVERVNTDFSAFNALMYHSKAGIDDSPTILQKHLKAFVKRNTCDFFIHKNLKRFLERELDFYIKNEILHIDDIDSSEHRMRSYLALVKTVKHVGYNIISFLAGIENFQKKLWLKKKFAIESEFCITLDRILDRIDEALLEEITNNDEQIKEWIDLYAINEIEVDMYHPHAYTNPLTKEFLKENSFLVLDTKHFTKDFKHHLITSVENFDAQCDGLLIHSDNFQAIKFLQEKYLEQIKGIFIDPPYNTGDDGFVYKDGYSDSCWLSMLYDRLVNSSMLLSKDASTMISIGDEEQEYLASLIRQMVGKESFFATLVWEKKKKGSFLSGNIAKMKDYILCYAKDIKEFMGYIGEINEETETYPCVNPDNPVSTRTFKAGIISKYRDPNVFKPAGSVISAGNMSLKLLGDLVIRNRVLQQDITIEANWRYSQSSLDGFMDEEALYITQDLYIRRIVSEARRKRMKDLLLRLGEESGDDFRKYDINNVNRFGWGSNEDANEELHQILGTQYAVSYPKPSKLITLLLASTRANSGVFMDYFAGSGTTAHAVINLNREDNGQRKYILCEMGDYFDTVTKPRVKKVIYSKDWDKGKPISRQGVSHCFKYITLEQYEDTLNNLVVKSNNGGLFGTYSESYLGYMLDFETRDSLFSIKKFDKPFDYKMQITRRNETCEQTVDLVETFNYLIGLYVEHEEWPDENLCIVKGTTRDGERTLIIWRNIAEVDSEKLNTIFAGMEDKSFDRIYVNGDNNLDNLRTDADIWKVSLTEETFKHKMFEEE